MSASVYAAFGRISHVFFVTVVDFPFVPQRQIPMVHASQQTTEISQLQYVTRWSMLLLCMSCLTCPSLRNDRPGWLPTTVGCRGLGGGGDAGSPTPRCSVTPISCMRWRLSTETFVIHLVRTTTTTTTTTPHTPKPHTPPHPTTPPPPTPLHPSPHASGHSVESKNNSTTTTQ